MIALHPHGVFFALWEILKKFPNKAKKRCIMHRYDYLYDFNDGIHREHDHIYGLRRDAHRDVNSLHRLKLQVYL